MTLPCHRCGSRGPRLVTSRKIYPTVCARCGRGLRAAAQRRYRAKHNDRVQAQEAAFYAARPGAKRAHALLTRLVHLGRLAKPSCCERCGAPTERRLLHGHHHAGYDRPLDVIWLCPLCHVRADRAPGDALSPGADNREEER